MPVLQFRKTETGKISRERTSSRRICKPHLFRSWVGKDWRQNLLISDGFGWSHITFDSLSMQSTSPSEVIAKLHEWMDTFQMNPKAICADMAFHHPHDVQAFYRMHIAKRIPTGPPTPWPNRAGMDVRLFKKFLLALVDKASNNLDQTTVAQTTCPVDSQGSNTLNGKTPMELAVGRKPRDLLDPASMNPEQLTSTPKKQDLLNEEIQKIGNADSSRSTTTRRHPPRS